MARMAVCHPISVVHHVSMVNVQQLQRQQQIPQPLLPQER